MTVVAFILRAQTDECRVGAGGRGTERREGRGGRDSVFGRLFSLNFFFLRSKVGFKTVANEVNKGCIFRAFGLSTWRSTESARWVSTHVC